MIHNLAVKLIITPVLIGGASLAGRKWGPQVGGWLVGFPMTSGPVAYFLAVEQGSSFAASAGVGMLAATASQVGFALAYRLVARDRWLIPFVAGSAVYVLTTIGLDHVHWTAWPTFGMVMAVIGAGYAVIRLRRGASRTGADTMKPRRWDIPARMAVATTVVLVITGLAPAMGPHLAGLLSPFPVFGIVLALFTHRSQGTAGAIAVLGGLVMGLATPAVFFLALALALPHMGLAAFGIATLAALLVQGSTVFLVPSRPVAASAPS